MPNAPELKRPDNDNALGLILAANIGFVPFTLLGRLIRQPIMLAIVIGSLCGLCQYGQALLRRAVRYGTKAPSADP